MKSRDIYDCNIVRVPVYVLNAVNIGIYVLYDCNIVRVPVYVLNAVKSRDICPIWLYDCSIVRVPVYVLNAVKSRGICSMWLQHCTCASLFLNAVKSRDLQLSYMTATLYVYQFLFWMKWNLRIAIVLYDCNIVRVQVYVLNEVKFRDCNNQNIDKDSLNTSAALSRVSMMIFYGLSARY